MSIYAADLQKHLRAHQDKKRALFIARFFKSAKGEYAEGDLFLGLSVPFIRKLCKSYGTLSIVELKKVLRSPWHEERLAALIIMCEQYAKADIDTRENIYQFYIKFFKYINNWDLVDISAYKIVGPHLQNKSKVILKTWAKSSHLWTRRIAILSTFHYIKQAQFKEALALSKILLHDEHDLIHKAVGWMLREIGKRDLAILEDYLLKHYKVMPRTMLRYAIERLPEKRRQAYLKSNL